VSVARAESRATRLLVMSRGAGSMNEDLERRLRKAFADHTIVDFDPKEDLSEIVSPQARIVVAGGDGSVEFIVRKFADTQHPIGIIPLGTFNNLAHALGLAHDLDRSIEIARDGKSKAITLGRVNDHIFVEACAIGLFGETIALGDAAKDRAFGQTTDHLKNVISARRFRYELSGDIEGSGSAMSLVFSNTGSIGSQLQIADNSPMHPYLEFSVHAGRTRTDIIRRAIQAAVLRKRTEDTTDQVFKFNRLEIKTTPRVRVYADNFLVGRTPATVTAETSALKVLMPQ
jgi:diacylglycerol kinase (ATP)